MSVLAAGWCEGLRHRSEFDLPLSDLTAFKVNRIERIEFEILECEAELLVAHVGTTQVFYIDGRTGDFFAKVAPLVPNTSTHPGLAFSRGEPTLGGCLEIIAPPELPS